MNYEDFGPLCTDGFTGTIFGNMGQLEVIGHLNRSGRRLYVVKCGICSRDKELFGDAVYSQNKGSIVRGLHPCGCSPTHKWTQEQYLIRVQREATSRGYTFHGFSDEFCGHKTKLILSCDKHGKWDTTNINHLFNGRGCPACKGDTTASFNKETKKLSDETFISSFMDSGNFHPDTKFWRSEEPNARGHFVLWRMWCPVCQSVGRAGYPKEFKNGIRTCLCSNQKQDLGYINLVKDGDILVAIKFGIAVNPGSRLKRQASKCVYTLIAHSVYKFPSTESCRAAETECKRQLTCGVIPKTEMSDGYSETTLLRNLDKIIEIYTKYGGVLNELGD